MGFNMKVLALLLVAVLASSLVTAQRGRGRGRGGRGPPSRSGPQGQGQGGDAEQGQGQGQGQRGPRGPGGPPGGRPNRPSFPGQGGPGRGERERPEGIRYAFNQTLSSGQVLEQRVFLPENKSVVISGNKGDREAGFAPTKVLYDFTDGINVAMVRVRPGFPCLQITNTLSYGQFAGAAATMNNTLREAALSPVALVASPDARLTPEDADIMTGQSEALAKFCRTGIVVAADPADAAPIEGQTLDIKLLTYDSEITLTIPANIMGRGRGAGRGRGRGRGRG